MSAVTVTAGNRAAILPPTSLEYRRRVVDTTSITVRKNGSFRVEGPIVLVDYNGKEFKVEEAFSLCRCGQSSKKPFCDSTHRNCGFVAEETAE
jgi:CDGSH-type Zn-finger protein